MQGRPSANKIHQGQHSGDQSELGKTAALHSDRLPYFDEFSLEVTRRFLLNAEVALCAVRSSRLTPTHVQVQTGHGGIATYLHSFRLEDNPGCKCDAEVEELCGTYY
ncbi:hypothetical protein EVAR_67016_1 [Eumeta japonica]|uniref:Uncharacterized protein n=1 Tax=Eumeta variegata TaxID=151549 RepID=A0A4C1ZVV1_EUMVA|nr:hypothetical protein EVAR_67016_1 [Eumeta japonica]